MSKYTTELRFLVEMGFDLGLKDYPIFDEAYRDKLNAKIIEHYYFREIGFETAELFKRFLNRTMNEIMPLYNQWYKANLLEFNPLITKAINESYERTTQTDTNYQDTKNNNITTEDTGKAKNVFSETPQGLLATADITNNLYATTVSLDDTNNNSLSNGTENANGSQNANSTNTETHTLNGYDGNVSDLILKYRQTFTNIDMKVIDDLKDLFMLIY